MCTSRISIIDSVILEDIHPRIWWAAMMFSLVSTNFGISRTIITSAKDGDHMRGSLHYKGLAMDFRKWLIPEEEREEFVDQLRKLLGDDYDVVHEKTHIHVEYDPD